MKTKKKIFRILKNIIILILLFSVFGFCVVKITDIGKYDKFIFEKEETIKTFTLHPNQNSRVNADDVRDYGNKAIFAIDKIQNSIEEAKNKTDEQIKICINTLIPSEELEQIQSYFLIYYGFADVKDAISYKVGNYFNYMVLVVDMAKINKAERIKEWTDKEIRLMADAIDKKKSDKEKVKEAAEIVAATIEYTEGYRDIYSAIKEHKGVCNSYAMLMKGICDRLDFHTDICFGYADEETAKSKTSYHAWNRIKLSNGKYIYSDLTAYDTSKNDEDIFMDNSPYNIIGLNTYLFDNSIEYPAKIQKISKEKQE